MLMGAFNLHSLEELVVGPFGLASLARRRKQCCARRLRRRDG